MLDVQSRKNKTIPKGRLKILKGVRPFTIELIEGEISGPVAFWFQVQETGLTFAGEPIPAEVSTQLLEVHPDGKQKFVYKQGNSNFGLSKNCEKVFREVLEDQVVDFY